MFIITKKIGGFDYYYNGLASDTKCWEGLKCNALQYPKHINALPDAKMIPGAEIIPYDPPINPPAGE